jgi:hypothetical protein
MNRSDVKWWAGAAAIAATAAACGSSSSGTTETSASAGTGGKASSSSASAGTGGTPSTSAGPGAGGGGGAGGAASACLDASAYSALFAITDATFCAVAKYTTDEPLGYQAPSWGTQHGPLVVIADTAGGGVTLERWTAPKGATGALTKQATHLAAVLPDMTYLNAQANDLPFFGWTAISWTVAAPSTAGAIAVIAGGAVADTFTASDPYALVGLTGGAAQGRLLYTGLSILGVSTAGQNGLYAADACSSPSPNLGAGTGCGAPALVSAWDENSGPMALDKNGDAFVVLTSATAGTQEARGFGAAKIVSGQPATAGTTLFTIPGFGTSLAAITPTPSAPGLLVFQPFDATTFAADNVVEQSFTVSGDVAASGAPKTLLTLPATSAGVSVMTDDTDRLWVASTDATSTTYVVLDRVH